MPHYIIMLDDLQENLKKCHTRKEIDKFIKKYKNVQMIGDFLIYEGEEIIKKGNYDFGADILLAVYESEYIKDNNYDAVTLYLRLAECYIENGNTDKGKLFLIQLCNDTADNYEEALEFRNLLPVWKKYKHLVQGLVKPPIFLYKDDDENKPLPTAKELLEELLEEVNSGGFDAYLSYHSEFFTETIQAAEQLNKPLTAELLKRVSKKFPNGKVPKDTAKTEAIIMDNSLDFEEDDDYFYNRVVKELLDL